MDEYGFSPTLSSFPRKAFAAVDEHHRIWENVSARMQAFRDKMERR